MHKQLRELADLAGGYEPQNGFWETEQLKGKGRGRNGVNMV